MKTIKIIDDGTKKTSEILVEMRSKFNVWCYHDDAILDRDFPPPKKATTRYFLDTIEADENLKNKSANDLEKENIEGITLRERLIMELDYFERTGNHLDAENVTLCSGSRSSDGSVPYVYWRTVLREVCVSWSRPSYSHSRLRARAVVSKPSDSDLVPSATLESAIELVKKEGYVIYKQI